MTQYGELDPLHWNSDEKLLIYGIGNLGRQDDGLGIRLIEKLETIPLPLTVSLESNYQLNVEDALLISQYDLVLFLDASKEADAVKPFAIRKVKPSAELAFSTHAMSQETILALCEELYGKRPRAFLLVLPGYQWEMSEEISHVAMENLEHAFQFLSNVLTMPIKG